MENLIYLKGSTRPEISTAVYQCAIFCNDPKLFHERDIRRIGKNLNNNEDKGIVFNPTTSLGLECCADGDFAGNWSRTDGSETILSKTGFIQRYAGCPIT